MAYSRGLTTRLKLLSQHRFSPSFAYVRPDDNRKELHNDPTIKKCDPSSSSGYLTNVYAGFGASAQTRGRRCSEFFHPMTNGFLVARHMSTTVGEGAEKLDYITDVVDVLSEKTVEVAASQAPAMSEIAVASADSWFPVAAVQYFIDGVHNFTGFNWWASIVVTTLLIRSLTVPLMINQLKATSKLTIMRPQLEVIKQEMQDRGMSPAAVAEGQDRMKKLFADYGVTPWTPLKGLLIQGPVFLSFFLAIQNMVDKVPSLKVGGAYWFVDLTTPDSLYILPFLTALTFWITVECNMQDGLEGNPAAGTMKNVSRVFAALTVPLTMNFPKAIFCYWVTTNLFSLVYGLVIKQHGVKRTLGIPIIVPVAPPSSAPKPSFSLFDAVKKYAAAQAQQQLAALSKTAELNPAALPGEEKKPGNNRIPSSSVLSQRIRSLEKEVKGRKKGKKM